MIELVEMLRDEECYIQIETIEIATEILEHFEKEIVENEYLPALFNTIEVQIEDITLRLA